MLSNEQREFYLENGYLIVENVLSAERLERARDALEERYALEGDQAGSEGTDHQHFVRRLCNLFSKGRVWEEMGVEPIVLDVAKLTIGEDVRWQAMNFHDPVPGESEAHQAIHADRSFFPNCTGYMNVCWVIDDITVKNGATRIVPGSHKRPWPRDVLTEEVTLTPKSGPVAPINPICRRNPSIPGLCRIASPTCARPFELSLPWSVRLSSAARRCILRTLPCDSSLPP